MAIVKLLLTWPNNAPPANCLGGAALSLAAAGGHEALFDMLLTWPVAYSQVSDRLLSLLR